MDYFDLSVKSKLRLSKWINKRYRDLCISDLVRNAPDERTLFKMCRYIDRWYDANEPSMKPLEVHDSTEDSDDLQEDIDEVPDEVPTPAKYEVPAKHVHLKQHHFSRHVSSRLNIFITQNPEVCISRMIQNAADEDDLMKAIDEVESRKKVVDKDVKMWTCRRL